MKSLYFGFILIAADRRQPFGQVPFATTIEIAVHLGKLVGQ
jgi:hypothetical protein